MERLALVAAAGAAAVFLPPVRDRVFSVTVATGRAGLGMAGAAMLGAKGIASAAIRGKSEEQSRGGSKSTSRRAA